MKVTWTAVRRVWIRTGLLATSLFIGWSLLAYRAQPEARAALVSDARVTVTHGDGYWTFAPASSAAAGLIRRSVDSKFGLDDEAIKAVTQWRFSPGTRFGEPVPVLVEIELSFRLT
jgi:hypothetical protein